MNKTKNQFKKALNGRFPFLQVFFVFLAFTAISLSSYIYGRSLEQKHLEEEATSAFMYIEDRLIADLEEPRNMLNMVANTMRGLLLSGISYEEAKQFINDITVIGSQMTNIKGFNSVFAIFRIFDNKSYNGLGWEVESGYIQEDLDWYKAAMYAGGEIGVTAPYVDTITGKLMVTYGRCVFDEKGEMMAIVCIDIVYGDDYLLSVANQIEDGTTWMLLDAELNIMVHPDFNYMGTHLRDADYDISKFADDLENGQSIISVKYTNYKGDKRLYSGRQLRNGLYLIISTPTTSYDNNLWQMQWFLIAFAIMVSTMLSVILVRLSGARNRAELRTQILIDAVPMVANFWNKKGENTSTNEEAKRLFGLSTKQEYLDKFNKLSPKYQPDGEPSGKKAAAYVKQAFDKGYCRFEWLHQTLEGKPIPCEITLIRVEYDNDYIVTGYTRDMREEKAMLEKIGERDALLRTVNRTAVSLLSINDESDLEKTLTENLEYLGAVIDADRVHIWRNKADADSKRLIHYFEWLSNEGKEKVNIPIDAAVPYEDFPDWENVILRGNCLYGSLSTISPIYHEFLNTSETKSLVLIPLFVKDEFWGLFAIDNCRYERDYTDEEINILRSAGLMMVSAITSSEMLSRIKQNREMNESLAHWYHSILDAIPLPISVTDTDMNWRFVNTAVENHLGTKRKKMMGKPCSGWNAEICNTKFCGVECVKRGIKQTYFKQNDLSFKVDVEELKNINNELAGYIEIVQNITEIEEMAQRNIEVERANAAKSAFLATVSHEIRTPMNTILGVVEIQMQKDNLPAPIEEAFGQIYDAGDLLLNIINDILDLSKIEAGKLEIQPNRYDIPSLIHDTVQVNNLQRESKAIDFEIIIDENTPLELLGDEFRIRQILNNLLSNAFKYTNEGKVTLSVAPEAGGGNDFEGVTLVFKVTDTGQGMSEEDVEKLFEEFTRFNLKTNQTIVGTGLGMSITKRLLDLMNGKIFVESIKNEGSSFVVKIPQKRVGTAVCGEELSGKFKSFSYKSSMRHKKFRLVREYMPYGSVLIVDDVSMNLHVAKGLMTPYGLKIDTVMSGIEAVERVKEGNNYDIIFMDHMMPGMNGIDAASAIRDLKYEGYIIALTANAVAGQEEMFIENGFDGFISKPIDSRELNTYLNDFIRSKKPPEVVEKARLEQFEKQPDRLMGGDELSSERGEVKKSELTALFIGDAERGIKVLKDTVIEKEEDIHNVTVIVHGFKSALMNIGQERLSAFALKLEKAGLENNKKFLTEQIPEFIRQLEDLTLKYKIEELKEKAGDEELSAKDEARLREKLLEVKEECLKLNKKAAKEILTDLQHQKLPLRYREGLEAINLHLLHSAFKKAAEAAEELSKEN